MAKKSKSDDRGSYELDADGIPRARACAHGCVRIGAHKDCPAASPEDWPVSLRKQFEKLVAKAERVGIAVVVDADAMAIRLIPRDVVDRGDDLRKLGDVVRVHGGCGGGGPQASGLACNYGNT